MLLLGVDVIVHCFLLEQVTQAGCLVDGLGVVVDGEILLLVLGAQGYLAQGGRHDPVL